jgi:membrane protein implicated in regulation of membrane protease activity
MYMDPNPVAGFALILWVAAAMCSVGTAVYGLYWQAVIVAVVLGIPALLLTKAAFRRQQEILQWKRDNNLD